MRSYLKQIGNIHPQQLNDPKSHNYKPNNRHDQLELLELLDKCTQIMRDDRLQIRALIKEGIGQEVEAILINHKKKKDMQILSQELRKYLSKVRQSQKSSQSQISSSSQFQNGTFESKNPTRQSSVSRLQPSASTTKIIKNDENNNNQLNEATLKKIQQQQQLQQHQFQLQEQQYKQLQQQQFQQHQLLQQQKQQILLDQQLKSKQLLQQQQQQQLQELQKHQQELKIQQDEDRKQQQLKEIQQQTIEKDQFRQEEWKQQEPLSIKQISTQKLKIEEKLNECTKQNPQVEIVSMYQTEDPNNNKSGQTDQHKDSFVETQQSQVLTVEQHEEYLQTFQDRSKSQVKSQEPSSPIVIAPLLLTNNSKEQTQGQQNFFMATKLSKDESFTPMNHPIRLDSQIKRAPEKQYPHNCLELESIKKYEGESDFQKEFSQKNYQQFEQIRLNQEQQSIDQLETDKDESVSHVKKSVNQQQYPSMPTFTDDQTIHANAEESFTALTIDSRKVILNKRENNPMSRKQSINVLEGINKEMDDTYTYGESIHNINNSLNQSNSMINIHNNFLNTNQRYNCMGNNPAIKVINTLSSLDNSISSIPIQIGTTPLFTNLLSSQPFNNQVNNNNNQFNNSTYKNNNEFNSSVFNCQNSYACLNTSGNNINNKNNNVNLSVNTNNSMCINALNSYFSPSNCNIVNSNNPSIPPTPTQNYKIPENKMNATNKQSLQFLIQPKDSVSASSIFFPSEVKKNYQQVGATSTDNLYSTPYQSRIFGYSNCLKKIVDPLSTNKLSNQASPTISNTDFIKQKYQNLFTSPQLLTQCKVNIESLNVGCNQSMFEQSNMRSRAGTQYIQSDFKRIIHYSKPSHKKSDSLNTSALFQNLKKPLQQILADRVKEQGIQLVAKFQLYQTTAQEMFDMIFFGDRSVSRSTFMTRIISNFTHLSPTEIDQLFDFLDVNEEGQLNINETGAALMQVCSYKSVEYGRLIKAFDFLDTYSKGFVTRLEIETLLHPIILQKNYHNSALTLSSKLIDICDWEQKGFLTYWELYSNKKSESVKQLIEIVAKT